MKKKFWTYLLAITIPIIIFIICATLNGFLPFGEELLNAYDSYTQYPGMLLEYSRLLRSGNIFYSWKAGLGFNFFGSITYYGISPLNLLALLASPTNYHVFITILTLIRFGLLGASMCFYLDKKGLAPKYVILFSTIYALMGYTSTYYYNYIWIDSIILLPLVIYGLDKILENKSPLFYIVTLTLAIIANYYIGYMICIFSLLWFIYKIIFVKDKKRIIKTFITSSLLSGLMCAVIILPTFFALMTGKAELYGSANYLGVAKDALTFFYGLMPGSYQKGDQSIGFALVYTSIFVLVLVIFYFFNKKITRKEKIASGAFIGLFYLSFSFNFLNYAWQMFQRPIWWQNRFSFLFSFLLITLAIKTIQNIEEVKIDNKKRIIIGVLATILIVVSALVKWKNGLSPQSYTYFFLAFSLVILFEMIFLADKKYFSMMLILFTFLELSLNTFNSLKNNYRYMPYNIYAYAKEEIPEYIENIKKENDDFFRMELADDITSNDGLYFGYNGFNYFNSARNIDVVETAEKLGLKVSDKCHIELDGLDPFIMSLLDIKYLYGSNLEYFEQVYDRLYEVPETIGLGFMAEDISDFEFESEDKYENRNSLVKALTGLQADVYRKIPSEKFNIVDGTDFLYSFKADRDYLIIPESYNYKITIDGKENTVSIFYQLVKKGQYVTITYTNPNYTKIDDVKVTLFDIANYEKHMEILQENSLHAKENKNGHILEGTIEVTKDEKKLFTSIEFEKGMNIYVDGQKVEPEINLGSLISIPLEKGKHSIVIDYVPRGFKLGLVISIGSLVGTVIYLHFRKKNL